MAYSSVKSAGAQFEVDWDVVERLCYSYWQTYYQLECYEKIRMSESSWYNPFSWSLPETQTIEIDWDDVRGRARRACASDMFYYAQRASSSMREIALDVKYRVEQTAVQRRLFTSILKDVQAANLQAMDSAVDDYTGLIEASRFIRDTSADVVAIGSTIATGGAAAGLLGASSAMKGYGKYQDTGKVGASLLYGAGSLVLGAFKIGGSKLTKGAEYTLIVVQGTLETGTSLLAGDTFAKAVGSGGLKIASAGAAQALFGASWVKTVFAKLPVPVNVWSKVMDDGVNKRYLDVADKLIEKTAKKMTEKGGKALIKSALTPARKPEPATAQAALLDEVPVEEMLLLNFAIVNMAKGIGRGW
jgi:hypothetical protein